MGRLEGGMLFRTPSSGGAAAWREPSRGPGPRPPRVRPRPAAESVAGCFWHSRIFPHGPVIGGYEDVRGASRT